MSISNDPQGAFIKNVARGSLLLGALTAHFDDHFEVAPEEVHWGHVGSAGKACEDLQVVCDFLQVKVVEEPTINEQLARAKKLATELAGIVDNLNWDRAKAVYDLLEVIEDAMD